MHIPVKIATYSGNKLENVNFETEWVATLPEICSMNDNIKNSVYTRKLAPEERISLLEVLRYDLGEITGYDYSQGIERTILIF